MFWKKKKAANSRSELFHVIKGGKSGFVNRKGIVEIDFRFEGASEFSEGFARIFADRKVGFIDTNGKILVPPILEDALWFSEGKAAAKRGGKWGYIDTSGEFAIPAQHYKCYAFENGLARVSENMFTPTKFIDYNGNVVLDGRQFMVSHYCEGLVNCEEDKQWGFVDLTNQFIIPPMYQYENVDPFSEGRAVIRPKGKDAKYGVIDLDGNLIIKPMYESIGNYRHGVASIVIGEGFDNVKFGLIDLDGNVIWEPTR